jgi:hypothetical protein
MLHDKYDLLLGVKSSPTLYAVKWICVHVSNTKYELEASVWEDT